jgi:hypothetical protein
MGDGSRYEFSRLTATFTKEEFGGYPVQLCLVASQGIDILLYCVVLFT